MITGIRLLWAATFGLFVLIAGGCLAGCKSSNAKWEANDVTMSTQFEFDWGTHLKIGFPGTVKGNAAGEGEQGAGVAVPSPAAVP